MKKTFKTRFISLKDVSNTEVTVTFNEDLDTRTNYA